MILEYALESPKSLLEKIIDSYRSNYKQIYNKAIRYIITQKIELIAYTKRKTKISAITLIRGEGTEPKMTYIDLKFTGGLLKVEYFCSCEDYFYSVHKSNIREFCSHALASFICLVEILYPTLKTIKTGRLYRCSLKHTLADWRDGLKHAIKTVFRHDQRK